MKELDTYLFWLDLDKATLSWPDSQVSPLTSLPGASITLTSGIGMMASDKDFYLQPAILSNLVEVLGMPANGRAVVRAVQEPNAIFWRRDRERGHWF